jgi:hypothetical protein
MIQSLRVKIRQSGKALFVFKKIEFVANCSMMYSGIRDTDHSHYHVI